MALKNNEAVVKEGRYVRTEKTKAELERAYREKLKMAEYCPKVPGCAWSHQKIK